MQTDHSTTGVEKSEFCKSDNSVCNALTNSQTQTSKDSVVGYLQYLCNKYGDFNVAKAWKSKDGEMHWSKHRSVMECWETEWGLRWLETVNNRQILPCEIVIDLDYLPTKEDVNKLCDILDRQGEKYAAYFTGSKGYHIHIKDTAFFFMTKRQRELIRLLLLKSLGADTAKKDEVMIALENVPHWKTGKKKEMVRCSRGWVNF